MTDLIVTNARIATVDASDSIAEAVAMTGEKIAAVGTAAEISALATPDTRIIDAGGRAVIPGLIDGHAHMDREGLKDVFPSLEGCRSVEDVLTRIPSISARSGGSGATRCRWNRSRTPPPSTLPVFRRTRHPRPPAWNSKRIRRAN